MTQEFVAEYAILLNPDIAEHLPGKHDQSTHGRKGGGSTKSGSGGARKGKSPVQSGVTPKSLAAEHEKMFAMLEASRLEALKNSKIKGDPLGVKALKANIAQDLASRLENNPDFQKLRSDLVYVRPNASASNEAACSALVGSWASTSGDSDSLAVALQMATQKEFGISGSHLWFDEDTMNEANTLLGDSQAGLQAFVRAQYDATQSYFASKGITNVTLYRGTVWNEEENPVGLQFDSVPRTASVTHQPISSFSTDPNQASLFAVGGGTKHAIVGGVVPVSNILSTPMTGFGCHRESEMTVLGHPSNYWTYGFRQDQAPDNQTIFSKMAQAATTTESRKIMRESIEPIEIDRKLVNADWTKGTWDIDGVDSLPALINYLKACHKTPASFMALPVYQLNVKKLPWLRGLASMSAQ